MSRWWAMGERPRTPATSRPEAKPYSGVVVSDKIGGCSRIRTYDPLIKRKQKGSSFFKDLLDFHSALCPDYLPRAYRRHQDYPV